MADKIVLYRGPGTISFYGRARQREWLVGFFVNTLLGVVIGVLSSIGPVLALPWVVAVLAVTTRRLHDIGHSGWWQLVPMSGIGVHLIYKWLKSTYQFGVGQPWIEIMDNLPIIASLVLLTMWVLLYIVPSNPAANCYGEVD